MPNHTVTIDAADITSSGNDTTIKSASLLVGLVKYNSATVSLLAAKVAPVTLADIDVDSTGKITVKNNPAFKAAADKLKALGMPTKGDGYIVGTTFHNTVMPLVRYRVSDRTHWRTEHCPCGRAYPLIEPVTGKFEDTLFGAHGQRISPSVVTFIFKSLHGIQRSQVAQVGAGEWEIRVVPAAGYDQSQRKRLVENVRELVDPDISVTIREVDDIARTSAHKYRWIVNEYSRR